MSTDLTSALSSINPELQTGLATAGLGSTVYNMYNQYQNQKYQNQLRSYAQDPAKTNAYANQFIQPLNAGLTSAVANNTQGYLASRGLSNSPAISQQVESQAIAPYIQQNQQAGYQSALQALQLGGGAVNPNMQQSLATAQLAHAFSTLPGLKHLNQVSPAYNGQPIQTYSGNSFMPSGSGDVLGVGSDPLLMEMTGTGPGNQSLMDYTPDYSSTLSDIPAVPYETFAG